MPSYAVFAAVTVIAVAVVLSLAVASSRVIRARGIDATPRITPGLLAWNVVVTHGITGVVILGAAWYADIPPADLGISGGPRSAVVTGLFIGVALAGANEVAQSAVDRLGVDHDETLRGLLTPRTGSGWIVLLLVALPLVAAVEELLFRAALIGAISAGFGVSPWGLAVASSVVFGLGHGLQGSGGIVVTMTLGFVLAVAFVVTGSLLVVVTAHYVVNVVEFLAHPRPHDGPSHDR